jgi:hypothetical protein
MKIALSGAHSQGKTTLLNLFVKKKYGQSFVRVPSPTRILSSEGFKINESGDASTQSMIMIQHFKNVISYNSFSIFDRCALDGLAYSLFFENKLKDSNLYNLVQELFITTIHRYDYIFYIEPELGIADDGVRSDSSLFFNNVVSNFEKIITDYNLNVIRVRGTVEQRLDLIAKTAKLL